MQEEVENKTLTLIVNGGKFTGRLLKAAISKYMAHLKEAKVEKVEYGATIDVTAVCTPRTLGRVEAFTDG